MKTVWLVSETIYPTRCDKARTMNKAQRNGFGEWAQQEIVKKYWLFELWLCSSRASKCETLFRCLFLSIHQSCTSPCTLVSLVQVKGCSFIVTALVSHECCTLWLTHLQEFRIVAKIQAAEDTVKVHKTTTEGKLCAKWAAFLWLEGL